MKARGHIDEVEGLYFRLTTFVPAKIVGLTLPVTVTIPTGPVEWPLLRAFYHHKPTPTMDDSWLDRHINTPLRQAILGEVERKYPSMRSPLLAKVEQWLERHFYFGHWRWESAYPNDKLELVTAKGEPYDLTHLERGMVNDLLGEALGDVDPKGVTVPKGLYGELDIRLNLEHNRRNVGTAEFTARVKVPHDVTWEHAPTWVREWMLASFSYGPPFNLHHILFPDEATRIRVEKLSNSMTIYLGDRAIMNEVSPVRWITADGQPFPTGPAHRRHLNRLLNQPEGMSARATIDQLVESPEYHIGNPKSRYDTAKVDFGAMNVDVSWDASGISASTTATNEQGIKHWFDHKLNLPDNLAAHIPVGADFIVGETARVRLRMNPEVKVLMKQAREELKVQVQQWIYSSSKNKPEIVKVKRPKSISLDNPLAAIKDFRFTRIKSNVMSQEAFMQMVNQAMRPGDEIIKVVGGGGEYFVLLSPDEKSEFTRRITQDRRDRVGGLLSDES